MEYSYYGNYEDIKPRMGVHYFMIDEYVKGIIEKATVKFHKDIEKLLEKFKNESIEDVKILKRDLSVVKESIKEISKNMVIKEKNKKYDEISKDLGEMKEIRKKLKSKGYNI